MKKKYLLALGLIGISLLSGCTAKNNSTSQNVIVEEFTLGLENVEQATINGMYENTSENYAPYKSILDETYDIVSGQNFDVVAGDDTMGLLESCGEDANKNLANVGFKIIDINEDGVSELLIVNNEENDSRILAIYTLDKDGKTPLFLAGGWMRNKLYLLDNNCVLNIGSSGADYTCYVIYEIDDDSKSWVAKESYFTDYNDAAKTQLGWFHNNTTASLEPSESEWLGEDNDGKIIADLEKLYESHTKLDLTYFKDYQK